MAEQIIRRGGSASDHESFIGAAKEVTVNTDNWRQHTHDGETPGGHETAKVADHDQREIDVAGNSDYTLSTEEARSRIIALTGALTGDINVIVPDTARAYTFVNATTEDHAVTIKTAAGTGVVVPRGETSVVRSDGADVVIVYIPGTAPNQTSTNADLPNSSAVGNEPGQLVKFEDDGEGGPRLPAADASQLTGFATKVVGEVFHLALRKSPSTSFPALRLTGESQEITDAAWPLLVPELRGVLAYYRDGATETDTFSGTVAGSVLTLDDAAAENELVEALAEDFLFSGAHKTVTFDSTDWQITDVDPVTREITVSGDPTDGAKTVEVHPYRVAGESGKARIGRADGIVLAGVGASGRMSGLATRDRMQQITGQIEQRGHFDPSDAGFFDGSTQIGAMSVQNGTADRSRVSSRDGTSSSDDLVLTVDSANSPNARTGTTTRDRSLGAELYIYGGQYDG